MRIKKFLAGVLPALALCVSIPTPAAAQSFFQTLFGFSKPAPQTRAVQPSQSIKRQQLGNGIARLPAGDYQLAQQARSHRRGYVSGNYRTICVRTCDGFYFPISSAASYGRFHKDARTCKSRCGGAELFYLPRRSDNIKGARNLSGRSYADLENAFRYRKTLVNGCACRPMPWSSAERARHRRYEYVAAVQKSYALAEARAKKRREDLKAARAAKKKADANAKAIALAEAAAEAKRLAGPQYVKFDSSEEFNERWAEASGKFAAPYYAYGRGPALATRASPASQAATTALADHDLPGAARAPEDADAANPNAYVPHRSAPSAARSKTASFTSTTRKRKTRSRGPVRRSKTAKKRQKKKNANVAFKGFFGNKKPKYSWPGD